MKAVKSFTCKTPKEGSSSSEIFLDGKPTGKSVQGKVLQGVFKHKSTYLVLMTEGCDYEECITVSTLNENLSVTDTAIIGFPNGFVFTDLLLKYIKTRESDTIRFNFGKYIWSVKVLSRPRFRVPLIPDTDGVWRPLKKSHTFKTHFTITKEEDTD